MEYGTHAEIRQLINETCATLGFMQGVTYTFNPRFTNRMGDANWTTRHVRLSTPLWPRASEKDRRETIIHEVCHVVASIALKRNDNHGALWCSLMRRCGVTPTRCHNVSTAGLRRRNRRYIIACECGTREMGSQQAARMRLGRSNYRCLKCHALVRFTGQTA